MMKVTMAGRPVEVDTDGRLADWWTAFVDGKWEPETIQALEALVEPGSYFVDIGAWVGPVSLYAAALGARVHCYEPDPKALASLRRNLELNPELAERITLHPYGLGENAGSFTLSSGTLGDSGSTLRPRADGETAEVEVRRFADEAQAEYFRQAKVVKVDVEGSEYPLLPDIARLLKANDAVLILSTHVSHIHGMLPSSWPRPVRIVARRAVALHCYAAVIWRLRGWRYWYIAQGTSWKAVSRIEFARMTMRPIRPQSGEVIVSPRPLPL